MPQKAAGCLIDPPVSVPVAIVQRSAATAAAEPPEEPPGTLFVSQGFLTGPKKLVSLDEPIANSSILVLPSITTPASLNLPTTVASYGAMKLFSMREPQVVVTPLVQKISLCARGMPSRGELSLCTLFLSASFAWTNADSSHTVIYELSSSLYFLIRSK